MSAEENFNVVVKTRGFADLEKRLILEATAGEWAEPGTQNAPKARLQRLDSAVFVDNLLTNHLQNLKSAVI